MEAPSIPWRKIVAVVVASRLMLFFVGLFTLYVHGRDGHLDWATWVDLTCRWDCGWYGTILQHGYGFGFPDQPGASNWAFYPLMPLAVATFQELTGVADYRVAGMLLSTVLFVVALGLVHRYARLLGNSERVAATSVLLIAFMPQGIVFSATYTESLFLALLAGTMVALRQRRYLIAGLGAAALSATRSNGVFIIFFIVVQTWLQLGTRAFFRPWLQPEAFLPLLMAPLGAFAFWSYAYMKTGDAFAMATAVRHGWGWAWESPLGNLAMWWKSGPDARFWVLGSLFTAGCTVLALRYRWYAEVAFAFAVFMLIWGGVVPNSLWRYSMVLFPAWIALAKATEERESMRMAMFAAMGLVGGFVMHAWTLQLKITI
jgi:hypothetical protein